MVERSSLENPHPQRRSLILGAGASALAVGMAQAQNGPPPPASSVAWRDPHTDVFRQIEAKTGGRLGVRALQGNSFANGYGGADRFPMCSTFKAMAVAALLDRVKFGKEQLDRRISFGQKDLLEYAPVTRAHVARGSMTLAELCEAAITLSDNTAANLILAQIGGPVGLTKWLRSVGDDQTRLDRTEPTLNTAMPGDPRDTTTPNAMVMNLRTLFFDGGVRGAGYGKLRQWMLANKTGDSKIRAGVPAGWIVADKTGSGENGTSNDIGIIYPPHAEPIVVAIYLTGAKVDSAARDAAIAETTRMIVKFSEAAHG